MTERHSIDERVTNLEKRVENLPTKQEMEDIIVETMTRTVFKIGRTTKVSIVTVATIIGAFVVIGGGLKWLLGLFGYGIIKG